MAHLFLLFLLFCPSFALQMGPDRTSDRIAFEDAVLFLTGVTDISELDEEELSSYRHYADNPLKLNVSTRAKLMSSGLFSAYQAASLLDYRARCGDILSAKELSMVDGFPSETASMLAFFMDFSPSAEGEGLSLQASAGAGVKIADGVGNTQLNVKAKVAYKGFEAGAALKTPWTPFGEKPPEGTNPGICLAYSSRRWLTHIVVGHFNARFGQGLVQWSGMQMDSYSNPSALMKRQSGIVPYCSYSPSYALFGAALAMDFGAFGVSAFADAAGKQLGGNLAWNHSHGEVGVTALISRERQSIAADFQHTVSGVVLYGEAAYDFTAPSGRPPPLRSVGGVRFPLGRMDCALRAAYTSDSHNVTAALTRLSQSRRTNFQLGASLSHLPSKYDKLKMTVSLSHSTTKALTLTSRASLTLKQAVLKLDLRQDVRLSAGPWLLSARANAAHCDGWGFLCYAELGYKPVREDFAPQSVAAYAQAGVFGVDSWNDRIYVYRRDAPGFFNVPALYGRGWYAAAYLHWHPFFRCKMRWLSSGSIYARADYTAYPWARPTDRHTRPSAAGRLIVNFSL